MVEEREKEKMKGSLTIEAALIIPFITFLILIIIFMSITIYSMLYANIVINSSTNDISNRWNGNFSNNNFHAFNMYKGSNRDSLKAEIENVIKENIDLRIPVKVNTEVSVNDNGTIFWDNVSIDVKCDFEMPFSGMFAMFGSYNKMTKVYTKNLKIANSAEGLRVMYYAKNLGRSLKEFIPNGSKLEEFIDIIENVKEGFDAYLE